MSDNKYIKDFYRLQKEANKRPEKGKGATWYDFSAKYGRRVPKKLGDLVTLIAYSYSWMPTIPVIDVIELKRKSSYILKKMKNVNSLDKDHKTELLNTLVPILNNSISGTSKFLWFATNGKVPILDSRVQRAWRDLFKEDSKIKMPSPKVAMNENHINQYVAYWEYMTGWAKAIKKPVREIEQKLFWLGKDMKK